MAIIYQQRANQQYIYKLMKKLFIAVVTVDFSKTLLQDLVIIRLSQYKIMNSFGRVNRDFTRLQEKGRAVNFCGDSYRISCPSENYFYK